MRNTFIKALTERAATDPSIMLLTGDLGYRVVEGFQERFPERYLNAGIAEQDMVEVAAGLALEGYKPFLYSIASFPTLRCLEQIRNCVCNPELDVTTICIGGGFAYGQLGMTHHATEDVAAMRSLPTMEVLSPADPAEAKAVAEYCCTSKGPKYVRINRGGEKDLPGADKLGSIVAEDFGGIVERARYGLGDDADGAEKFGKVDVAFLATGAIAQEAVVAAETLASEGISSVLFTVPRIKPLDEVAVIDAASMARLVVTLEEHTVIGGLGSAVAETLEDARLVADMPLAPVLRIGIPDRYPEVVGDQAYLRKHFEMDGASIAGRVRELLKR